MRPIPPSRRGADGRRYRRRLAVGLAASVVLHGALAFAWRAGPGPGIAGDGVEPPPEIVRDRWDREAVRAVELKAPERRVEVPPPPAPVRAAEPSVRAPAVAGDARLARVELTPRSAGRPGGGREGGEAGGGSRRPPVPRSVLPEWDPPDDVRGTEVVVRVHVDSAGRPTGPVELRPPTRSEDFNRRLRRKVRAMSFRPARVGGRAVAGWAELTFTF